MTVPCEAVNVVVITTEWAVLVSSCTSVILLSDWLSRSRVSPFLRLLDLCLRLRVMAVDPAFFLVLVLPAPLVGSWAVVFVLFCEEDDMTVVATVPVLAPEAPVPLPGSWESLLSSCESRRPRNGGFSEKKYVLQQN